MKVDNKKIELQDTQIKLSDTMNLLKESQTAEQNAREAQTEMQDELAKKVNECIATKEKQTSSDEKGRELGAEVLTLINQKEQFTKLNASLNAKLETAQTKIGDLEVEVSKNEKSIASIDEELSRIKVELDETRAEKLKVELELRKTIVSFEQSRLDIDKNTADFVRQRDNELFNVRKSSEEEISSIKREKDDVIRTNSKLEAQVRGLERKIRDMEINIQRVKGENFSKNTNSKRLEAQLNDAREQYRSKLLTYLGEEAMAAKLAADDISKLMDGNGEENGKKKEGGGDGKKAKSSASSVSAANSRAALEDLIKTYKTREKELLDQIDSVKLSSDENMRKNRLLYDSYYKLRDKLEDATDGQSSVKDLPPESELKVTDSQLEKERDDELAALRQAVAQMRSDGAIQKDRAVELSQSYREMVQTQEEKLKELASKMALLQNENDRLMKEKEEQKDQATLKALEANMEDMQKNILDQIRNVKIEAPQIDYSSPALSKRGKEDSTDAAGGGGVLDDAERRELNQLRSKVRKSKMLKEDGNKYRSENASLKEQMSGLKLQLIEARAAAGAGAGAAAAAGGRPPSSGSSALLRTKLHEAELEKHKLATKVTMLTDELEAYKQYMKQTIMKYKNEIAAVKRLQEN